MNRPEADPAGLAAQLERMQAAQRHAPRGLKPRQDDLRHLGDAVRAWRERIIEACNADFGRRSRHETLIADVMTVLDEVGHARKHLRGWMRTRRRHINTAFLPARAELKPMPLGVVGVVSPWNYPINLALIPLVNALAAGNHVMLKPSESSPNCSRLLAEMLGETFPGEQVCVIEGGPETGAAFCALRFDHLLFTGSTAIGRKVAAAAAPNLTPITLELGGKSPALIAPDYPIQQAVERIVAGKCLNAGQTCVAPDYVLVHRDRRGDFVEAWKASMARRYPTLLDNPDVTGIISNREAARLNGLVDDARMRGLEVVQHLPDVEQDEGDIAEAGHEGLYLVPPTLILEPEDEAAVMQAEIFGPVLPVQSYENIEEAIAYIQERDRPLAFYPFDRNRKRLARTLDAVIAGSVCVNDTLIQFGQHDLPIGGVGASGMGHYHGRYGFDTFSKLMPIVRQPRLNAMRVFDPPYGKIATWLVKLLSR